MPGDKKRTAVKARKLQSQAAKGARRRTRTGDGQRRFERQPVPQAATPGLSITVNVPFVRRPQKIKAASLRRLLRPVVLVPLIIVAGAAIIVLLQVSQAPVKTTVTAADRTSPDFTPLVPSAEEASEPRYDPKRNLVSYTTTFSGTRITVSQQPLPETFKKDKRALNKAAESIKATRQLTTDRGPLHIATNEENGNQLAVFTQADLLLFIQTDRTLDDVSWVAFIELLKAD